MKVYPRACTNCNAGETDMECPIHAHFLRHELYTVKADCWHPKGTALAWNEEEEKQGVAVAETNAT